MILKVIKFSILAAILIALFPTLYIFPSKVVAQTGGAVLSLSPATGTFNKGCSFLVDIILDTGGTSTSGADIYLIYDPTRFRADSSTKGTIYQEYVNESIDNSLGLFKLTGVSSTGSFTGNGKFASVKFSVLSNAPTGVSEIKFDFDPADLTNTADSNVLPLGGTADILSRVNDGSYVVGTGNCGQTVVPKGGIQNEATSSGAALPQSGSNQALFILMLGVFISTIGFFGYFKTNKS